MKKIIFTDEQIAEIINCYVVNKKSLKEVANKFNVNVSVIQRVLKENNINTRSNSINSRKYYADFNYFEKIDTEHKAYWLGFIYADGYISSKQGASDSVGISLALKDVDHLIKFKNDINATYPINNYVSSGYGENDYCRILIASNKLAKDLISHGVLKQKTNILSPPTTVPDHLIRHFIRGYFDGDGCLSYYSTRDRYSIKILGTKEFLDFIKDFIYNNINYNINKYYKRKPEHTVCSLEISSEIKALEFLNIIYADSTICLERKYNRYLNLCNKYSRA